jgi:hypothetical protein
MFDVSSFLTVDMTDQLHLIQWLLSSNMNMTLWYLWLEVGRSRGRSCTPEISTDPTAKGREICIPDARLHHLDIIFRLYLHDTSHAEEDKHVQHLSNVEISE